MSLQFQIVWAILVVEVIAVLLLILPVSLRLKHHVIRYLSSNNRIRSLWYALRVAFVVILLLFVDAGTRSLTLAKEKKAQLSLGRTGRDKDMLNELQFNLKLFYAQRNMYLTGFTLFLAIILKKMISLTMEGFEQANLIHRLRTELETSTKEVRDFEQDLNEQVEKQQQYAAYSNSQSGGEGSEDDSSLLSQQEGLRQRRPVG